MFYLDEDQRNQAPRIPPRSGDSDSTRMLGLVVLLALYGAFMALLGAVVARFWH